MRNKTFIIVLLVVGFSFSFAANAQLQIDYANVKLAIPSIALIDIEPDGNNSLTFEFDPTTESGLQPMVAEAMDKTLWINYTSALPISQSTRSISAEIASGSLPNGINLNIEASSYSGIGLGNHGQSIGKVELSGVPKTIIYDIGNCFTGDGINNGHELNFTLGIEDFAEVRAMGERQLTIVYTISDL